MLVQLIPSSDNAMMLPNYDVVLGDDNTLQLNVNLPSVTSAADLSFEVSASEMELEGGGYHLQLAFVNKVDDDTTQVRFDKSSCILQIRIALASPVEC